MKKILLLSAAVIALAAPAAAADLATAYPVKAPVAAAPFSWTGFYIGANAGVGFFSSTTTNYETGMFSGPAGDFSESSVGGFVGGTVGYNVQFGQAVVGVEGDLQWASLENDTSVLYNSGYINSSWDWFGTIRARAGLAFDRALVYITGGAAFVSTDYSIGSPDTHVSASGGGTKWGFAAGAGVEYAFTDHWTAKAEYLYIGLPTETTNAIIDGAPYAEVKFQSETQLVRVGVNYKF